ncbi:HAD domain-containing protein [Cupriavidus respiraculi]|uniref:Uncharacterized protein n=1 Tax=Cupriavidus respiraculi TaxID=195930 RepID=A0ABN7Y884_9BURK|nr:HAD domain-containing protein [Cupriavidus respiraculi]MBY4947334.1 hypothetical protein [Cupriavidus respiraculi]CAG9168719.1 hypothetical protein LMG21510_01212 [Cupriavidus respiraculi]
MSERIILLDVPGVLYSTRSAARLGGIPDSGTLRDVKLFDPIALGFIRRLFGLTGARVVLSDSWRRGTPAAILGQLDLQVEAMMPPVEGGPGAEIAAYLASRPAPQGYVIFTSRPEAMPAGLGANLVAVDPAQGLTLDNFKQALDVLGVACPSTLYPQPAADAGLQARLLQLRQQARTAARAAIGHELPLPDTADRLRAAALAHA